MPEPWPRQDTPTGWPTQDTPTSWPSQATPTGWPTQDTPSSWPSQATPTGWPSQDTAGSWPSQDTVAPLLGQDTPGPWLSQDSAGPSLSPNRPSPPAEQGTPDPWPGQAMPDQAPQRSAAGLAARKQLGAPTARARSAVPPVSYDPFGDKFAAGRQQTTELPDLAATGLLTEDPPRPRRTMRRPRGRSSTIIALLAAVTLAAGGAAVWQVKRSDRLNAASTPLQSQSPRASSSAAPSAAASSPATRPTAGNVAVTIVPAVAGDPHAHLVAALLTVYFSSINNHDFQDYEALFIPQIRGSSAGFSAGYRTTTDSDATLVELVATGQQNLAATVTFTSRQNPADSPNHAACDRWNVVLTLKHTAAGYLIGRSPPGYHPSVRLCA